MPRPRQESILFVPFLKKLLADGTDGMKWVNEATGKFEISWVHQVNSKFNQKKMAPFVAWATHKGRVKAGQSFNKEDMKGMKSTFRCAMNKMKREVVFISKGTGTESSRVYKFKTTKDSIIKKPKKRMSNKKSSKLEVMTPTGPLSPSTSSSPSGSEEWEDLLVGEEGLTVLDQLTTGGLSTATRNRNPYRRQLTSTPTHNNRYYYSTSSSTDDSSIINSLDGDDLLSDSEYTIQYTDYILDTPPYEGPVSDDETMETMDYETMATIGDDTKATMGDVIIGRIGDVPIPAFFDKPGDFEDICNEYNLSGTDMHPVFKEL